MTTTTFNWTAPLTLSTSSINSYDPQIAIDPNGNIIAVWVENGVIYSNFKLVSGNWDTPVSISSVGVNSSYPNIVVDSSGTATAIWIENTIVKSSTKPLSGSWSSISTLSSTNATYPTLAISSAGDCVAVWVRNGSIETTTKPVAGSWPARIIITSTMATAPHVAIGGTGNNARAVIAWHSASTNVIYIATRLMTSGSWSTQLAISKTGDKAAYPKVAVDDNANITAVWFEYILSGSLYSQVIVKSAERSNTTNVWNEGQLISKTFGNRNPADLSLKIKYDYNGNAIATWNTSVDGETYLLKSNIKPTRSKWKEETNIVNSLYSNSLDIDITSIGNVLSTFPFYNSVSLLVLVSEINLSQCLDSEWTVPVNISVSTNNGFPKIASVVVNNTLYATIIYVHYDGTNTIINIVTGSRPIVLPPTNLSVTQNSINYGIFTNYYNTIQWTASNDPNLNKYCIYRDGIFIKQIDGNVTSYVDNNRIQNGATVYGIVATDSNGYHSVTSNINYP